MYVDFADAHQFISWNYPSGMLATSSENVLPWNYMASSGNIFFQPGDPCLARRHNTWYMYYSAIKLAENRLYILEATLPSGDVLRPTGWILNYTPIISPGVSGSWNYSAVETPSYVRATIDGVDTERIYYMGYNSSLASGNNRISYAQNSPSGWINYNTPLFSPSGFEYNSNLGSLIGDQNVYYHNNLFHMHYQAINESSGTVLCYRNSTDGVNWVNAQRVNFNPPDAPSNLPDGPYHVDSIVINNKWFLCGWLPKSPVSTQGLYITTSQNPLKVNSTDFTEWIPLLYESSGNWFTPSGTNQTSHVTGLFGSDIVVDGSKVWCFYHAVNEVSGSLYVGIGASKLTHIPKRQKRMWVGYGKTQEKSEY